MYKVDYRERPAPKNLIQDSEMSSDESDVELDMEGVLESPDSDEPHEMGDVTKKEMTDEEMEKFDEARGNAMSTFSEVGN